MECTEMKKTLEPSYILACRFCLQEECNMTSIYEARNSEIISERVMYCTNIVMERGENYPNKICNSCLWDLDIAVKFKRKCEESDKLLRTRTMHTVKEEILDEAAQFNSPYRSDNSEDDTKPLHLILKSSKISRIKSKVKKKKTLSTNHLKKSRKIDKENMKTESVETISNLKHISDSMVDGVVKNEEENSEKISSKVRDIETELSTIENKKKKIPKTVGEFKCETCGLVCQSRWVLKVHLRTHSGERPYQCELCLKRFVSNSNMRMHRRLTHGDDRQVCSECGKSFSCMTYLKRHLVIHLEVKPYGCSICRKRFTTKSYLKEHLARHRGDKQFFCELCGTKFISDVNLKQHMQVHGVQKRNFKRHQCTFCEYRTTGQVDLARHIRKHTGEKPFRCPHHGCSSAFAGKASLNLHLRIHTGEKPYTCSVCSARFSRGDKHKSHMMKKHNISAVGPSKRSRLVIQELVEQPSSLAYAAIV